MYIPTHLMSGLVVVRLQRSDQIHHVMCLSRRTSDTRIMKNLSLIIVNVKNKRMQMSDLIMG